MQTLDIRTISFVAMLSSILLAVCLQLVNRVVKNDPSVRTWSRGATSMGAGFILIALRGLIPDLLSIVLANALLVGGLGHIHVGNRLFAGLSRGARLDLLGGGATALACGYFTYLDPDLASRIIAVSLLFACIAFASAGVLFRLPSPRERFVARFLVVFYLLAGAFLLFRALATPLASPTQDYMQAGSAIHGLSTVMGIMLNFCLGVGLTLLVTGRMQNTLRESQARFATIFRASPLGIALTRLDDGTVVEVNDALLDLNGYRREELLNRTTLELQIWADPEERRGFVRQLETQGRVRDLEVHIRRKSGEIRNMLFYAELIELSGTSYILTQVIDISERKQAEIALHELNATLEKRVGEELARSMASERLLIRQSRLAAMGEMISNIAHQWRQPISAIGLLLTNLKDSFKFGELTQEEMARQVETGQRLVQKMSVTIDDFRNFFRPNQEMASFSLAQAVAEAQGIIGQSLADHDIRLEVAVDEEVAGHGYPNEFSQVLLNLLNNAKEAILHNKVKDGLIRVSVGRENNQPTVRVADNGGGIPEDILPKVFDPYFTTKAKGTGIGLYMSKMIMEHINGAIEAGNAEQGAEFRLTLASPPAGETGQDAAHVAGT